MPAWAKAGASFDESCLFCPWHIEAGTIASVEGLVLRRNGIDGNTLCCKSLNEADEIVGIGLVVLGVEGA